MYRKLLLLTLILTSLTVVSFAVSTSDVLAVDVIDPACETADPDNLPAVCKENAAAQADGGNPLVGPDGVITNITQALVYVIAAISTVVIVIGGLKYVLSGGDPQSTKSAKDTIMYALIGVAIAIVSQSLVLFVLERI